VFIVVNSININEIADSISPGGLQRVAIEEAKFLQRVGHSVKLISLIRPFKPNPVEINVNDTPFQRPNEYLLARQLS
jgi:hypothetical protein